MTSDNKRFGIKIDYIRESEDPGRVFRAMSGLIDALQTFDQHLGHTISADVSTSFLLEDIESGSITTWLKNTFKSIPGDALKELEWKRIFGHFLFETRASVIGWLEERETISTRDEVKELQDVILFEAERTSLNTIPAYNPPSPTTILSDVTLMKKALDNLKAEDKALYLSGTSQKKFNHSFSVSGETIRELLTLRTITSEIETIVQVKKPDYLGASKWLFKFRGHQIEASISDSQWLREFQSKEHKVLPGDSLRVDLKSEISYGYEGELVHESYVVTLVKEVIPLDHPNQGRLLG